MHCPDCDGLMTVVSNLGFLCERRIPVTALLYKQEPSSPLTAHVSAGVRVPAKRLEGADCVVRCGVSIGMRGPYMDIRNKLIGRRT